MKNSNIHIRVDDEMKNWLNILENKYRINPSHFIREAIVEKMKRDIKQLRVDRAKRLNDCPF